ncbi:nuclear transport factor 2 family protein [Jeotgalibacillus campisalis]|uniref:DUF4440 domain-containing protein n=1 Tax=Jeotgalibacillus campisalis TaxID=220754 RepID=A0A0C2QZ36_9BACL|nr:DUF4440 domain-containing protein [Jeotgalibacillus campisalis]KIL43315.1 hypothetical protein KR50_37180 [Jeotgalibacillus campisalis]
MNEQLRNQFRELEEWHINTEVRKSKEELDKILANDFFEIGSSGRMFTKQECLDDGVSQAEMSIHQYEIHPLSESLVLSTYLIANHTRKRNTLRSSIWKKIDGRWQLFFHQGTVTNSKITDVIRKKN